jgi:hypothetical protein
MAAGEAAAEALFHQAEVIRAGTLEEMSMSPPYWPRSPRPARWYWPASAGPRWKSPATWRCGSPPCPAPTSIRCSAHCAPTGC